MEDKDNESDEIGQEYNPVTMAQDPCFQKQQQNVNK